MMKWVMYSSVSFYSTEELLDGDTQHIKRQKNNAANKGKQSDIGMNNKTVKHYHSNKLGTLKHIESLG